MKSGPSPVMKWEFCNWCAPLSSVWSGCHIDFAQTHHSSQVVPRSCLALVLPPKFPVASPPIHPAYIYSLAGGICKSILNSARCPTEGSGVYTTARWCRGSRGPGTPPAGIYFGRGTFTFLPGFAANASHTSSSVYL